MAQSSTRFKDLGLGTPSDELFECDCHRCFLCFLTADGECTFQKVRRIIARLVAMLCASLHIRLQSTREFRSTHDIPLRGKTAVVSPRATAPFRTARLRLWPEGVQPIGPRTFNQDARRCTKQLPRDTQNNCPRMHFPRWDRFPSASPYQPPTTARGSSTVDTSYSMLQSSPPGQVPTGALMASP